MNKFSDVYKNYIFPYIKSFNRYTDESYGEIENHMFRISINSDISDVYKIEIFVEINEVFKKMLHISYGKGNSYINIFPVYGFKSKLDYKNFISVPKSEKILSDWIKKLPYDAESIDLVFNGLQLLNILGGKDDNLKEKYDDINIQDKYKKFIYTHEEVYGNSQVILINENKIIHGIDCNGLLHIKLHNRYFKQIKSSEDISQCLYIEVFPNYYEDLVDIFANTKI